MTASRPSAKRSSAERSRRSGFVDGPALGRQIYAGKPWEVVGIVEDVRQFESRSEPPAPRCSSSTSVTAPPGFGGTYFAVRTNGRHCWPSAQTFARSFVNSIQSATVDNVATMEQII